MEAGTEHLQTADRWFPILPTEGLPEGVDSWMRKIPSIGNLFVSLENKPGGSGFEDDNRVYILAEDNPSLLINGEALFSQGFKPLNVALVTDDGREEQEMQLGLKGKGAIFETILESRDHRGPLKLTMYWYKADNENQSMSDLRDVMVTRDQLKDVQIRFPEGGES